ncbi:MAG: PGPGW domain-containing protein [Microlunatus sp.]
MSAGVEDSSAVVRDSEVSATDSPGPGRADSDLAGSHLSDSERTGVTSPGALPIAAGAPVSAEGMIASVGPAAGGGHGKHHHVLIEADEDRWAWRRRIRQNPHQLRVYRIGVAIAGLLLICLGIITGPLPGPGGIPLVLLGLATWSSEFEWAYRLRLRLKAEMKKYSGWPTAKKVAFWLLFSATCGSLAYSYLLLLGIPFWMPEVGASLLDRLPGVHAQR